MSLNNIPDEAWNLLIGGTVLVVLVGIGFLLWARTKAESITQRLADLITMDSPDYCGTCMLDHEMFTHREDHFPPQQSRAENMMRVYGRTFITDHEYSPLFLVDISPLTREPEAWERYGRYLHLRTRT